MSPTTSNSSEVELKLLLPRLMNPPKKSVVDLRSPGLVLSSSLLPRTLSPLKPFRLSNSNFHFSLTIYQTVIWDLLFGIPFSLLIALANKAFMQWLGYEKIMGCPSGILASRVIMIAINLFIIWDWRKQLIQEENEGRIKAEVWPPERC